MPLLRLSLPASLLCAVGYLSSSVALATDEAPAAPSAEVAAPTPQTFVSQGQPMTLESLGVVITPPLGWEVATNTGSMSVVMREPKKTDPDYVNPKYQKNITIAAIHNASPIDEKRAVQLEEQLVKAFGSDPSISEFHVMEHKFFNYHGANDGLLVYTSMNLGEYPMTQMHVLVSGQDKQFLMTYTDLAKTFGGEKDAAYTAAWDSMVSVQVTGESPQRFKEYLPYAYAGGGFLVLVLIGGILRLRAHRVDYKGHADAMIDAEDSDAPSHSSAEEALSGMTTLTDSWNFAAASGYATVVKKRTAKPAKKPETKPTSFVSDFSSSF